MPRNGIPIAVPACLILFAASFARAGDPLLITAQSTSGPAQTITASGSNLPSLFGDAIKSQGAFAGLQNDAVSGSLRYGNVNNAVEVTRNASSTSATLTIPSIGFSKTFNGANEADLEKQIKDFAKNNGASVYGRFLRSINGQSDLGVTDGNPLAATAIFANQSFLQFGLQPTPFGPGEGGGNPLDEVATANIRFDANGGYARTPSGSSYYAGGAFSFGFKFGDRVGLVFATPFEYRNSEGADVYNVAEEISLPVVLVKPTGSLGLSWMLTPTFTAGAAGSVDLAAGGVFLGGGITSSLSVQIDGFVLTLGNQFDYFHGFPIRIGQFKFDTDLDQEVLKNGLKISKFFGNNFFVDGSLTYTNFLQDAAVKDYLSPGAGIGFRFGPGAGIRVGYTGDFGHGFNVTGGQVELYFNY